jgi:hypothetical protein
MKHGQIAPVSPNTFHQWSDEHRALVWGMIEKLGKGEITFKEAKEVLREEEKALSAISKQVFGSKARRGPAGRSAARLRRTANPLKPGLGDSLSHPQ